jgi:hypothetical protein
MSQDRYVEVTRQSWFGRIGGAIKGVLVGAVLVVVAFPLLFWNEGRAVARYKTLVEGGGLVVSVAADRVDPANAGKLVHVAGKADTSATLTDPAFGVSAPALKLRRAVEMYQWDEREESKTEKKLGGGTETVKTYTYHKTWSSNPIRSAEFKIQQGHENPPSFAYEPTLLSADKVTLGAFTLSPSLVAKIGGFAPLQVSAESLQPERTAKAKLYGGGFYVGANPAEPKVGDLRITFEVCRPVDVSLVAKQAGDSFVPYVASTGGTIELLELGVQPAAALFQRAQESNRILTWVLRLAGFLLMLIGFNLIFKPLSVLADVLPFLGSLVAAGTGFVAFLLAAALSFVTIAVAWLVYRPVLGGALLSAAVLLAVVIAKKLKAAKRAAA